MHSKTRLLFSTVWTYLKVLTRGIWNRNLFAVLDGIERIREQSRFFESLATELYQAACAAKARGDYEERERLYQSHSQSGSRGRFQAINRRRFVTAQGVGESFIPPNHNATGTCGSCGGPIISPMCWAGTGLPSEHCAKCGKRAKPRIEYPTYGPIREMI